MAHRHKHVKRLSGWGGIVAAGIIIKQGFDWHLNGATKTAAVLFLVAWFVSVFGFYISDYWKKFKIKGTALHVVAAVGLAVTWWAYLPDRPAVSPQPAAVPQVVMPITTTWRGMLVPSSIQTPPNACSRWPVNPNSLLVLFGNQVAVLSPEQSGRSVIVRIAGENILSFLRRTGEISLSATIRRESGEVVGKIENNEFQLLSNEDYYMERPDAHTLTVVSPDKVPVLYVKYLNPSAVEFRGVFYYPGYDPLYVRAGVDIVKYRHTYQNNCWETPGPIFDLL